MHESLQLTADLPHLRDPLVIAAFWGWSDGTGSAMGAMRFLREAWGATELGTVDPERFYDLTVARPRIRGTGAEATVRWPGTRFHIAHPPGSDHDVVLIAGREPSLAWIDYSRLVADLMQTTGARHFLTLGARPALVPHTRPSPIVLADADEHFVQLFGRPSQVTRYEGPTGIQTVIAFHLRQAGLSTARLTALVPGYLNVGPSPRAILALTESLNGALGANTSVQPLLDEVASFERQVELAVSKLEDPQQMRNQVLQLEEQYDALAAQDTATSGLPSGAELVEGIEDLLRQRRDADGEEDVTRSS